MTQARLTAFLRAASMLTLVACAVVPRPGAAAEPAAVAPPTVIVVRHAEKVDDSRDPALSDAGAARAEALAEALEHAGLDAVYASQFRRTRLTATPAAEDAGLPVRIAPIEGDVGAWAQGFTVELAQTHADETVLVAGHSNTVPPLVAALCDCTVEPLTDRDYDRIYIVTGAGGGQPELVVARYGSLSADD